MNLYQPTITGSLAVSGSVIINGPMTVVSGSLSGTASLASTASSADNFLVRNTLTAQTLVVQTITSSIDFVTGSTRFGTLAANTHTFTGSILASGSVGIGVTSPSFPLEVSSSTTGVVARFISNQNEAQIRLVNTSTGGRTYSLGSGGTNSGGARGFYIYDETGTFTAFAISGSGNVGIGTNSPITKMQLQEVGGPSVTPTITLSQDGDLGLDWVAGTVNFYSNDSSANSRGGIGNIRVVAETAYNTGYTPSYMAFYTHPNVANNNTIFGAATEKMRITAAGDVGIGVTPATFNTVGPVLQMGRAVFYGYINEAALGANFRYENGDKYINSDFGCLYQMKEGKHVFTTAPSGTAGAAMTLTTRMIILNNGNVGIGTSSPGDRLTIATGASTSAAVTFWANAGTSANELYVGQGSSNEAYVFNRANQHLVLGTNNTERMRISSTGTTTLAGPNISLNVQSTYTLLLGEVGAAHLTLGYKASTAGYIQTWQSTPLYLNNQGNAVYAGSARIDNNSDIRVKDNIQPITGALDKVLSITGKKFHMVDEPEDKIRMGFIAQELQGVLDELVIESDRTQTLPSGEIVENVLGLEIWGSSWAALLVEAIKELKADNDAIRAELAALKS